MSNGDVILSYPVSLALRSLGRQCGRNLRAFGVCVVKSLFAFRQ